MTLPSGKTIEMRIARMDWPHSDLTHTVDDSIRADERGYAWLKCDVFDLADNTTGKIGYHSTYRPCLPDYGRQPQHVIDAMIAYYAAEDAMHATERAAEEKQAKDAIEADSRRVAALPQSVKSLVAKYRTSDRAWEAEDEEAWAALSANGF